MFVPRQFQSLRPSFAVDLMCANGWAILVTAHDGNLRASHLPFVHESAGDEGHSRLLGHMNRANPHWRDLRAGAETMVIFQGTSAYVSPTLYQETPAAPSYNYTAVHAYGHATLIEDTEATLELLRRTVEQFEAGRDPRWDIEPSMGLARQLVGGVVAFSIDVERIEAAAKLSQNKKPVLRDRVIDAFSGCPYPHGAVAREMIAERDLAD